MQRENAFELKAGSVPVPRGYSTSADLRVPVLLKVKTGDPLAADHETDCATLMIASRLLHRARSIKTHSAPLNFLSVGPLDSAVAGVTQ